ncbi:MAG: oligosaccharide flippase family protein [Egibacteraceae bacterium]
MRVRRGGKANGRGAIPGETPALVRVPGTPEGTLGTSLTTADGGEVVAEPPPTGKTASAKQIRGSTILLVGRLLSKVTNAAATILISRYLSKSDYGAFAYGLSIVSLGETIVTLGLDRAVTRFVPIYEERGEYKKLFGTLVLVVGVVLGLSIGGYLLLLGLQGWIAGSLVRDRQVLGLLLILVVLSPIQAIDGLLMGMFSVFSSPKAIFFRRNVLAPLLTITVVGLLVLGHADVRFLAVGYVLAGVAGVGIYTWVLLRMMRKRGLSARFSWRGLELPWAEVLSFTIPVLTSDLVYTVLHTSDVVLLERYHGTVEIAAFRVVAPVADANQVVFSAFVLLFTPLAARLFARNDRRGLNDLYWQTAVWIAVFSFPIFALTSSLAHPLTVLLFGQRYGSSATYLALLSIAYYVNAAFGFNGLTLKVYGLLRYIVAMNFVVIVVNLGLNLLLIPRYGALGAAIGTSGTLIVFNVLKQAGLGLGTGIKILDRRYLRVYLVIAANAAALYVVQAFVRPSIVVTVALATVSSFLVLRLARSQLNVGEIFPELLRVPYVRKLLGA